jgi:hypothetical protein
MAATRVEKWMHVILMSLGACMLVTAAVVGMGDCVDAHERRDAGRDTVDHALVLPESDQRIDFQRSACRSVRSQSRHRREQERNPDEHTRVCRGDAKQQP